MIHMEADIVAAHIVSHPTAIVMHVRRFRVTLHISESMIFGARWRGMLRRRGPVGGHKAASHAAALRRAAIVVAVILGVAGNQ
jgi:hypothetical protein